jgi:hypothetical protein
VTSGPLARLSAAFAPNRLGAHTALSFAVEVEPPASDDSTTLSSVEFEYPSNLGLATSGLGLEACEPAALEVEGAEACPPDSKMGSGSALAEVPFGPETIKEDVALQIFAAPSSDGYIHLAILAEGKEPVIARVVLSGVVLRGRIKIAVPLVESLPEGPYVQLVRMRATLGGALTYYERSHGHTVAYHPAGLQLPDNCPRGGWRLGATLAFSGGQSSRAVATVVCPRRAPSR